MTIPISIAVVAAAGLFTALSGWKSAASGGASDVAGGGRLPAMQSGASHAWLGALSALGVP